MTIGLFGSLAIVARAERLTHRVEQLGLACVLIWYRGSGGSRWWHDYPSSRQGSQSRDNTESWLGPFSDPQILIAFVSSVRGVLFPWWPEVVGAVLEQRGEEVVPAIYCEPIRQKSHFSFRLLCFFFGDLCVLRDIIPTDPEFQLRFRGFFSTTKHTEYTKSCSARQCSKP